MNGSRLIALAVFVSVVAMVGYDNRAQAKPQSALLFSTFKFFCLSTGAEPQAVKAAVEKNGRAE